MTDVAALSISLDELRARRLIAQILAPSQSHPLAGSVTIASATEWMVATQFQLRNSGLQALAVRAKCTTDEVAQAVSEGTVIRSWSQRGTHHALFAPDVSWVTRVCTPRVQIASAKRRAGLGLTDDDVDQARIALTNALAKAEQPLSRTECYEVFAAAGVNPEGQKGPHMLRHFGGEGDIIQGPPIGNMDSFALYSTVVSNPRDVDKELGREAAIGVLAARYINSHGPATPQDFAWWSGLTVKEAKGGFLATKASEITTVTCNNIEYAMGAWQHNITQQELDNALTLTLRLPAFDEYILGYKDRSQVMDAALIPEVGPSKNGMCWPFIVTAGVVQGKADD